MDLNVFKVPIGFLKFCGIWIPKDSSQIYKIYAYFMQILFLYIWSLMMGAAVFYQKNLIDLSSALTFFFTYFVCVIKCVNLIFKIDKFLLLIEDVKKAIKDYGLTEIYIEKHLSFGKKLFLAYWMPVVVTVGIGAIKPYIILKISYQMWFPYDPSIENSVFLFYLSATYQSVETLLYSTANVMIDTNFLNVSIISEQLKN
ncbi:hypothetical protein PVAND_012420 [Polypedilum vanderplanki]|uniref:Odorant receptor n=1 Tax=Polypedilum vanderplanki TaxID=319348 RepID=A0A9J6CME2_POLVA|nr:hypothetical protein PVAND_012420 [Polypedilum vanderplanki]